MYADGYDFEPSCLRCRQVMDQQVECEAYPTGHPVVPGEAVNHPAHYNLHPSGVECIDVVEHYNFNLGNAMKYLWRARDKGAPVQDLQKAVWYIQREIARMEAHPETVEVP
jgi:hypothetical protein